MNFYLDFEALQFSGYIISIGCVNEKGQQFKTLVRPPEGERVTNFITNLTGITNEMLAVAPSADEAFIHFFNYLATNGDDKPPQYYCYGDTDVDFLRHTMNYMTDVYAYTLAQAMSNSLIDYSKDVKTFFVSPHRIALRKVYNLIKEEENDQKHDALEDAMMLAEVVEKMKSKCRPEDNAVLAAMPAQAKPAHKKAPEMFLEWPNNMWDADTRATPTNWQVCATCNDKTKYFDSLDTAALWAIKYITRGFSPKKQGDIDTIARTIMNRIQNGRSYCNFKWYSWTQAENADPYVRDKED